MPKFEQLKHRNKFNEIICVRLDTGSKVIVSLVMMIRVQDRVGARNRSTKVGVRQEKWNKIFT